MNARKGPNSWKKGDACEKLPFLWLMYKGGERERERAADESKSEGCLVSAIDCTSDSSSRQPLITPLTDSGAGGAGEAGGKRFCRLVQKPSRILAKTCYRHPLTAL